MNQPRRGLSQEQQDGCRVALLKFLDRHGLTGWEMTVRVQETALGKYSVKTEIAPRPDSGMPKWPLEEIAVADPSFDVAAEVHKLLELGYQARLREEKALTDQESLQP